MRNSLLPMWIQRELLGECRLFDVVDSRFKSSATAYIKSRGYFKGKSWGSWFSGYSNYWRKYHRQRFHEIGFSNRSGNLA